MSVLQRTLRLFVLAAAAMAGQLGFADGGYHPFSEPMNFDPDWQFFAPVQLQDLEDLSTRQRANHGFFLTYDRVFTGMSRSNTEAAGYTIDMTWGNRWDFGWMNNHESGWSFSAQNVTGPNVYNWYLQQRLNTQITTNNNGGGGGGTGTTTTDPSNILPSDNDFYYQQRVYEIKDSLNVGSFTTFEANKTWRLEPYRYGGLLEPMLGLRYVSFIDTARNDVYSVKNVTVAPVDAPFGAGTYESLLNDMVFTRNDMILGQLGFRYTKFIKRFTWSSDFKAFSGHNFQTQETERILTTTVYPTPPTTGTVATFDGDHTATTFSGRKGHQTPVGFDLRTEGSFKATKNLDFRAGFQMIYFGKGIWRGSTVTESGTQGIATQTRNDQHLIMPAFTFGVALNR